MSLQKTKPCPAVCFYSSNRCKNLSLSDFKTCFLIFLYFLRARHQYILEFFEFLQLLFPPVINLPSCSKPSHKTLTTLQSILWLKSSWLRDGNCRGALYEEAGRRPLGWRSSRSRRWCRGRWCQAGGAGPALPAGTG